MPTILRIYGECLARIPKAIAKSPWVLALPIVYSMISTVAGTIVAPLGMAGGFLMGFVSAVLGASFLYFVDEVVTGSPVKIAELPRSFQRYLWPVINVLFVFWIASIVAGTLLTNLPMWASLGITAVLFILLNATPEVIYQRRLMSGMDVIMGSVNFIQENWIEWFIPNLLLVAIPVAVAFGWIPLLPILGQLGSLLGSLVLDVLQGALLFVAFVFRGHLFAALDGSTARARKMRYGR